MNMGVTILSFDREFALPTLFSIDDNAGAGPQACEKDNNEKKTGKEMKCPADLCHGLVLLWALR
jgi:hypothetical protein